MQGRRHLSTEDPRQAHDVRRAGAGPTAASSGSTAAAWPAASAPAPNKGVGACFVEVEVDTWTGDWRFLRAIYVHDTGLVINPLVAEADMVGSLVESTQIATDPIPWDREFPGTRHYSVGYLSYRLPTIMDMPKQTQVFIDSLEPRWFYGIKSFSETSIGAVPGAHRQRDLQRLRRPHPRASDHARKDHGGLEGTGARWRLV